MDIINLKLIPIKYKVGDGGLGTYSSGYVIDAYEIESNNDSNIAFIYHPEETGSHEVAACIDVCGLDDNDVWCPVNDNLYINLRCD